MKRVGEHNVTHQAARIVVTEIDRWIELEIFCDVAGETDRRRVFGTALPIDLDPPPLVEVVGISKNCFVFVASMNGSGNQFVMLGVVASFDIRLRIYVQVGRPIHEPNRRDRLLPANPVSRFDSSLSSWRMMKVRRKEQRS